MGHDTALSAQKPLDIQSTTRTQEQARWLHSHLFLYITVLAIVGWVSLLVGRSALPWTTLSGLVIAIWCGVAAWHGLWNWSFQRWVVVGSSLFVWFFSIGYVQRLVTKSLPKQAKQTAASVWRFPGFVLFSGLGLIWITDLAARGPIKQLFFGVHQSDALLLGYAAFTIFASLTPSVMTGFSRVATFAEDMLETRKPMAVGLFVLAVFSSIFILGGVSLAFKVIQASQFGEGARVLVWLVNGWLMYRWVDRDRPSINALYLVLGGEAVLLLTYAFVDKGQALVTMLSLSAPMAILIAPAIRRLPATSFIPRQARILLSITLIGIPFVALLLALTWLIGPLLGSHIAERIAAISDPFTAGNDFLARLFWLSHASGMGGFGLTQVPWCGYIGSIGGACHGVPEQIQSDYVIQGLSAVWGMPIAVLVTLCLCTWLLGMLWTSISAERKVLSLQVLRSWVVAFFALTLITQTFVTSFGALGAMPLTGIPLPLLSYGNLGLLVIAVFAGLSMHNWQDTPLGRSRTRQESNVQPN